ncbi:AMP-binding enzyme family protein [Mycobacterium ulcerans str. Harvey]|uniref:AMP-binding enzyme family protein n=1 Tax=Mycobacterium ulcerans str. Harvey TaxID=1299332 RepID=A0ABN0QMB9_MYCUL|nr:AMP-binding enzyme family protein [Mycobacterium ulcerans str. Harvey]
MLERIIEQAQRRPEAIALRRCDGTSALPYGELVAEVDRYAGALRAQSASRGSRVLVISDNGPETYLAVLACAKLGAIAVMADGNLPPATIDRFCQITDPVAVLIAPGSKVGSSSLPEGLAAIPAIRVDIGSGTGEFAHSPDTDRPATEPGLGADDPLAMIFTSGTTGEPKAVLLANRTFFAVPDILRNEGLNWVTWVDGETTYSPLPATHIGGLWWILTCLMRGGLCITGGENTPSLMQILNSNAVNTTCLVPTLLSKLVSELKSAATTVPSLRLLGYGGSRAIAADVRFIEATGVRTAQVYGLSETGCTALCLPTDDGSIAKIEAGAVGRPTPAWRSIWRPTTKRTAPAPTPGRRPFRVIRHAVDQVAGKHVGVLEQSSTYPRGPDRRLGEHRRSVGAPRGWFLLHQGAVLGDDHLGRREHRPDEVDRIAEGVPGVREAACFEIPDPEFGALVGLAVVAATDVDASAAANSSTRLRLTIAASPNRWRGRRQS